jgi:hypothetical protein
MAESELPVVSESVQLPVTKTDVKIRAMVSKSRIFPPLFFGISGGPAAARMLVPGRA